MTSAWARHPVRVRHTAAAGWWGSCAYRYEWFSEWTKAIDWATKHASVGDDEGRWCDSCQRYQPTCDDYCLECGADT